MEERNNHRNIHETSVMMPRYYTNQVQSMTFCGERRVMRPLALALAPSIAWAALKAQQLKWWRVREILRMLSYNCGEIIPSANSLHSARYTTRWNVRRTSRGEWKVAHSPDPVWHINRRISECSTELKKTLTKYANLDRGHESMITPIKGRGKIWHRGLRTAHWYEWGKIQTRNRNFGDIGGMCTTVCRTASLGQHDTAEVLLAPVSKLIQFHYEECKLAKWSTQ